MRMLVLVDKIEGRKKKEVDIRYELSRRQVEHVRKVIEKVVAERFFTEVV